MKRSTRRRDTAAALLIRMAMNTEFCAAAVPAIRFGRARIHLQSATRESEQDGVAALTLHTDRGDIDSRYHAAIDSPASMRLGVVFVGGAGGGLDGPARGLYPAVAEELRHAGVASLRADYRHANELENCVLDTLCGVEFLRSEGVERVALVGHSFGGAVVISAAAVSRSVYAVVPMSSQTYGTDLAPAVSPRPMLLIHGTADDVLPDDCSRRIFAAAREPKELKLFDGAGHGLDAARETIIDLLVEWIPEQLARARL